MHQSMLLKRKEAVFVQTFVGYSMRTKDKFPLPRIDETIDYLYESKFFSTLDLISGYWQIEIDEKVRPKTAFSTDITSTIECYLA